jgi:hypothetical protein
VPVRGPVRTSATVSALNSRVCVRRAFFVSSFDMWHVIYARFSERGCPPDQLQPALRCLNSNGQLNRRRVSSSGH